MYQINSKKRYNVDIVDRFYVRPLKIKNVKLLAVEPGFVALEDEKGKERIFTGATIGIYISES